MKTCSIIVPIVVVIGLLVGCSQQGSQQSQAPQNNTTDITLAPTGMSVGWPSSFQWNNAKWTFTKLVKDQSLHQIGTFKSSNETLIIYALPNENKDKIIAVKLKDGVYAVYNTKN